MDTPYYLYIILYHIILYHSSQSIRLCPASRKRALSARGAERTKTCQKSRFFAPHPNFCRSVGRGAWGSLMCTGRFRRGTPRIPSCTHEVHQPTLAYRTLRPPTRPSRGPMCVSRRSFGEPTPKIVAAPGVRGGFQKVTFPKMSPVIM